MANRESIFDKYNMSAGERRVVMFVAVVLIGVLAWMAFDMIPKPEQTKCVTCYDCSKCICLDQNKYWDNQTTAKFFQDLILRTNDTQHFLRYVSVTDQVLYMLQWMHCLALCIFLDLENGRSKKKLLLSVSWALSAKERNRLAHALNGNTPLSVIFYGDSSCYCKNDKKIKKEYGGIWEKLGWNFAKPLIQYKAGATVAEVAEMIENGKKVDVIVVSLLGNDFIDNNWQALNYYPEHADADHRRPVAAAAAKRDRCALLLPGAACVRWQVAFGHRRRRWRPCGGKNQERKRHTE